MLTIEQLEVANRKLTKQLEVASRKLTNANHQKQASQKAAHDAQLNETISKKETEKDKAELSKTRDRYQTLEQDLQINKLRNECAKDQTSILRLRAI